MASNSAIPHLGHLSVFSVAYANMRNAMLASTRISFFGTLVGTRPRWQNIARQAKAL
jgi:hypothetical protein